MEIAEKTAFFRSGFQNKIGAFPPPFAKAGDFYFGRHRL